MSPTVAAMPGTTTPGRSAGFDHAKLRAWREAAGLYRERVCVDVGISASFLGLLEDGLRVPSVDTVIKLADFYGHELATLIGWAGSVSAVTDGLTEDDSANRPGSSARRTPAGQPGSNVSGQNASSRMSTRRGRRPRCGLTGRRPHEGRPAVTPPPGRASRRFPATTKQRGASLLILPAGCGGDLGYARRGRMTTATSAPSWDSCWAAETAGKLADELTRLAADVGAVVEARRRWGLPDHRTRDVGRRLHTRDCFVVNRAAAGHRPLTTGQAEAYLRESREHAAARSASRAFPARYGSRFGQPTGGFAGGWLRTLAGGGAVMMSNTSVRRPGSGTSATGGQRERVRELDRRAWATNGMRRRHGLWPEEWAALWAARTGAATCAATLPRTAAES